MYPYTKILIGIVSGWISGVIVAKVGREAAFIVGLTIVAMEIAQQQGYIKSDWLEYIKNYRKRAENAQKKIIFKDPQLVEYNKVVDSKVSTSTKEITPLQESVSVMNLDPTTSSKIVVEDVRKEQKSDNVLVKSFLGGLFLGFGSI